ncbi:hypothetical protein TNCV_3648801 [Trichonephila clavipes]|nr:hypothetical protein TNCV_3648801 [Trichonephila clavipes]
MEQQRMLYSVQPQVGRIEKLAACYGAADIAQTGNVLPWCTRKCHSTYAPLHVGGQVGFCHSNPGNGAAFPG